MLICSAAHNILKCFNCLFWRTSIIKRAIATEGFINLQNDLMKSKALELQKLSFKRAFFEIMERSRTVIQR